MFSITFMTYFQFPFLSHVSLHEREIEMQLNLYHIPVPVRVCATMNTIEICPLQAYLPV